MKVVENDANPPPGKYVTAAVIAEYFHLSVSIIYKWAQGGKIPSIRFEDTVRF
ncbi:MAG: helix-turn-helix domain-containing protein [Verrucomicrobia bacterium]|nr:helix-turn-helix domain-containing protein [Verrucomicrobiota bacterium]